MSTKLEIKNLVKQYGGNSLPSVADMNLTIEPGEMVAFLGPSGCGKTTTLRMISGLLEPTDGDILFNGESVLEIPLQKREVSMLFPHMSIFDNVAFGLKMRKCSKPEISKKVEEMLNIVKLGEHGSKKPTQLSGGQEQRVSLARGLVIEPSIFLLDEPLSSLDATLRIEMREMIFSIQRQLRVTSNFVTVKQTGNKIATAYGTYTLKKLPADQRDVYLVVRNECFEVSEDKDALQAVITQRIFMGTSVRYFFTIDGETFQATMENTAAFQVGYKVP